MSLKAIIIGDFYMEHFSPCLEKDNDCWPFLEKMQIQDGKIINISSLMSFLTVSSHPHNHKFRLITNQLQR